MGSKNKIIEQVKASRRISREEEIAFHDKPINYSNITKNKKKYNRKNNKKIDLYEE